MPKLSCRILVLNDEHLVLRELSRPQRAARALDNPSASASPASHRERGDHADESDGDLQAVLVDDTLYPLARKKRRLGTRRCRRPRAVKRITGSAPSSTCTSDRAGEGRRRGGRSLRRVGRRLFLSRGERTTAGLPPPQRADPGARHGRRSTTRSRTMSGWRRTSGYARALVGRGAARSPWVNDFYEFMGEHVFDADVSVSWPRDSLIGAEGRDRRGAGDGRERPLRTAHIFATNGTTANKVIFQTLLAPARSSARSHAQERASRCGPFGRAPHLPRLGAQPQVRALCPVPMQFG